MFKDVIIGQYIEGNSFIHRMDPKMKLILTFLYMILLFTISSVYSYAVVTVFTLFFVMICSVPLKLILKGLKPMFFILLFTAVMNLLLTDGEPVFEFSVFGKWDLSVTKEGIKTAVLMVVRLMYLLIGTSVLTLTTTPLKLTDGIERLLNPLKKIKVPAHEIAMMMSIALRFIPTLADETDKIIKAQSARGADFDSGGLIKKAKAMIPILVPLFVSAFRRADELATAMEARCYHGGEGRTKMNESHVGKADMKAFVVFIAIVLVIIIIEVGVRL